MSCKFKTDIMKLIQNLILLLVLWFIKDYARLVKRINLVGSVTLEI